MSRVKVFSLSRYIEASLRRAQYDQDENGVVVGMVPGTSGFFAQGETYEEALTNLQDAIEGNVLLALQLGWEVPAVPGVDIRLLKAAPCPDAALLSLSFPLPTTSRAATGTSAHPRSDPDPPLT